MHALPTIHKKEELAADNAEAQRILREHGDTTTEVFAAKPNEPQVIGVASGDFVQ